MHKLKLAVLLTVVCIFAASVAVSAAGPSNGDWPKFGHDARNSSCSPATAIALPSLAWISDTSGRGVNVSYSTYLGPILDANNLYTNDAGDGPNGYVFGFKRDGTFLWIGKTLPGAPSSSAAGNLELAQDYVNRGGLSLWNDGTKDYVVPGPGGSDPNNALWWLDKTTGVQDGNFVDVNTTDGLLVSYDSSTVGPDGTIYTYMGDYANYFFGGTIYAIDGITRTIKWSWGANGTVPGAKSLGFHFGPMALTTVNGKTVLIVGMAQDKTNDIIDSTVAPFAGAPYNSKSLFAIQDDGTSCSVLWSTQTNYNRWSPAVSNDGKTVYIACDEAWQGDPAFPGTLYAYDTTSGALKWQINTHAEHFSAPTVGKDGTIYLTSTCVQANLRNDTSGKLIAVQDNGNSALIKWSMYIDYESDSWYSTPVVNSSTQPVVYFGSTSGRLYAVQDLGFTYKLLWAYCRSGAGIGNWPHPVIGNDGTLYAHWGKYVMAFKSGYDGSPFGITGYVKTKNGDPIAGAYVSAFTSANPLMGNNGKYFVKTDSTGFYRLTVPAGKWYVAAWTDGRLSSDQQVVTTTTDMSAASLNDFVLPLAGLNLALGSTATTNSPDNVVGQEASKAVDGNSNSRFTSNEANPASISATNPTWLMVDLGSDKSIGEALFRWEAAYATSYKLQCLPDGVDPAVEANWASADVAATTTGNWGLPISWDGKGNILRKVELVKFAPRTARYWRLYATGSRYAKFISMWELELRDGKPAGPDSGQCGDVRSLKDGDYVLLEGKAITAIEGGGVPTDVAYIEDSSRAGAIRIHVPGLASKNLGIGDKVSISGSVATVDGEKYVETANINKTASPRPLDAVAMNSRNANDKASKGLFVKLTGKVGERGAGYFVIDDGGVPVKVNCGSIAQPDPQSNVKVRGVLASEGGSAVLLTRDALDIAAADATSQPLPLAGAKKYFRDCIIVGPFTDASAGGADNQTKADALMAIDFLGGEANANPAIGDTVTYNGVDYKWQRYNGASDIIDFNAFFPGAGYKEFAVAYAVVYIYSPIYQTVDLTLGSDDELRVWLNTTQVFDDPTLQGVGYSQKSNLNSGAGVDLMPGLNTLVFKVVNAGGGFAYSANIIEWGSWLSSGKGWGDGTPIQGLGYYPDKP